MKYGCTLFAVSDMKRSIEFYRDFLGQEITMNIENVNVSFNGGRFALQQDFGGLVAAEGFSVTGSGNDHELVFEEEDFDGFLARLESYPDLPLIHPPKQYPWLQRVVRFFDPDGHPVEVGESMGAIFRRLRDQGDSVEAIAQKTMHPAPFIEAELSQ